MSTDEYEGYSVDDDDQLQPGDTLDDQDLDDVLDRGYAPADRWREVQDDETLDERLAEEEPDIDPDADVEPDETGPEVGRRRSGRLVAPDAGVGEDTESELIGTDVGIDGAAASAEEAAVHVVDEN